MLAKEVTQKYEEWYPTPFGIFFGARAKHAAFFAAFHHVVRLRIPKYVPLHLPHPLRGSAHQPGRGVGPLRAPPLLSPAPLGVTPGHVSARATYYVD